jgi:diamine N-acetyltransferase
LTSLQGKNVILRAVEPEDLEWLYKWENSPEVWLVSNTLVPFSRYVLREYLKVAQDDIFTTKQLRLMIDLVDSKTTIGSIDLFEFDPFNMRAGIGVLVAANEHRRQGFADEALELLIRYAFGTLKMHQLFCNVSSGNTASIHLFQKHRFVITGEKKDWMRTSRGWENEFLLQLINPE